MRMQVEGSRVSLPLAPLLPALLQAEAEPGRLLGDLLDRLDLTLAPAIDVLDSLHAYVDPDVAPADFLAWMGEWLGVADLLAVVPSLAPERDTEWLPRQRDIVKYAARLAGGPRLVPVPGTRGERFQVDDVDGAASRGTLDALERLLGFVIGRGQCAVEVSSARPHVSIQATAPVGVVVSALEEAVRRVARHAVPAHVTVEVVVVGGGADRPEVAQ